MLSKLNQYVRGEGIRKLTLSAPIPRSRDILSAKSYPNKSYVIKGGDGFEVI